MTVSGRASPVRIGYALTLSLLAPVATCTAASAASVVERVGVEFAANSTIKNRQLEPTVAALSNGDFAVSWTDESYTPPDTSGSGIRGRVFSRKGIAAAKDFLVNNKGTDNQQYQPASVGLKNGGYYVIWSDRGKNGAADEDGQSVRGQRFSNSGAKQGNPFTVNRVSRFDQYFPAITAMRSGGFAASWDDWSGTNGDDSVSAIRGQSFSAANARLGQEFRANTITHSSQSYATIAGLSSGNLVVAWTDNSQEAEFNGTMIRAQLFSASGAPIGIERLINRSYEDNHFHDYPSAAGLLDGKYVVVWEHRSLFGADGSGRAIRGQIMSSAGAKVGPEFLVNSTKDSDQTQPAVTAFPGGRFVVVWTDASASPDDPSGTAVRGQIYAANGDKLGSEFKVNKRWEGNQSEPAVATLNNRDFVVVWTDWSGKRPDNSALGIRGQVFHTTQ